MEHDPYKVFIVLIFAIFILALICDYLRWSRKYKRMERIRKEMATYSRGEDTE